MKHSSSRALYAYWDVQRGTRTAPERADIDPAAIRHILADTFVLAADFVEENRFRLAGTKVCSLFCRELKDEAFAALWSGESRKAITNLLAIVGDETLGVVAGATGSSRDGLGVELEMLLLPLARRGHARVRALGILAPVTFPYWLGAHPLVELRLGALRHVGPSVETDVPSPLIAPVAGGRVRNGFVVYDGGRSSSHGGTPPA